MSFILNKLNYFRSKNRRLLYSKTKIFLVCRAELMLAILTMHSQDYISIKNVNGFGIPSKIDAYCLFI